MTRKLPLSDCDRFTQHLARNCITAGVCEACGQPASYCDSIPDASLDGYSPGECGYRLQPLCWLCGVDRRMVATSRVQDLLVVEGVGYLDRGRAGGDCVCLDCGRKYYDHPQFPPARFLNQLCDGSLVKL